MEMGLDEFIARDEMGGGPIAVREGDVGPGVTSWRGKMIPESRLHYERLSRQGIPMCPRAYDGCSAALEGSRMSDICTQNYSSCDILNGSGVIR